jgi:hypothetical protein
MHGEIRHVWKRIEKHSGFGEETAMERGHLYDLQIDGRKILKWIVKECWQVRAVVHIQVMKDKEKFLTRQETFMFLRRILLHDVVNFHKFLSTPPHCLQNLKRLRREQRNCCSRLQCNIYIIIRYNSSPGSRDSVIVTVTRPRARRSVLWFLASAIFSCPASR